MAKSFRFRRVLFFAKVLRLKSPNDKKKIFRKKFGGRVPPITFEALLTGGWGSGVEGCGLGLKKFLS
jgi:hypothetical protein